MICNKFRGRSCRGLGFADIFRLRRTNRIKTTIIMTVMNVARKCSILKVRAEGSGVAEGVGV
jgi:hypothetical protein